MGEKGTAHHGTKKQQRLSRADDESVRAGLGDTRVLKGTCVTVLAGRVGAHVLMQGHTPAGMREMLQGCLL